MKTAFQETGFLAKLLHAQPMPKSAPADEQHDLYQAVLGSFEAAATFYKMRQPEKARGALGRADTLLKKLALPPHARLRRVLDNIRGELAMAPDDERALGRAFRAIERARAPRA